MIEAVHTAIESESVHRPTETLFHFLRQGPGIYFMKILAGDRDIPSVREMRKLAVAGSK